MMHCKFPSEGISGLDCPVGVHADIGGGRSEHVYNTPSSPQARNPFAIFILSVTPIRVPRKISLFGRLDTVTDELPRPFPPLTPMLELPVLCAGLAFIVFTEVPSMATILGGSVVLIVVLMSIRSVSSG